MPVLWVAKSKRPGSFYLCTSHPWSVQCGPSECHHQHLSTAPGRRMATRQRHCSTAALRHCHVCHAELPPKHAVVSLKCHFFQFDGFHVPMSCTVTEHTVRVNHGFWCIFQTNRHLCRVVACPKRQDSERIRISRNSSPSPSIFRIFNDFHIFIRARCPKNGILTSKGLRFFSKLFHLFSSDIPMTFLTFLTAARTRTLRMVTDGYGWLWRLQLEEVPLWLCKATAKALWQPVLEAIVHWIYCLSLLFAPLLQYLLQR